MTPTLKRLGQKLKSEASLAYLVRFRQREGERLPNRRKLSYT